MKRLLLLLLFAASIADAAKPATTKPTEKKAAVAGSTKKKSVKKVANKRKTQKNTDKVYHTSFLKQLPVADRQKLEQLYRSDPKAFQREIRSRMSAWKREKLARENKETYNLIRIYQRERNPKKKVLYKQKLTDLTRKQFLKRLKENKYRIKKMEKTLKDLKAKNSNREKNANKIIEERVRYLTTDPSLRW
jgi:hypothetical protein